MTSHLTSRVNRWLEGIATGGFPNPSHYITDRIDYDDQPGLQHDVFRVFDPYYGDIVEEAILKTKGKVRADGTPYGKCSVFLQNGDEIYASFGSDGTRRGPTDICGKYMARFGILSLKGKSVDGILRGIGTANVILANRSLSLEGVFNDGYLEGPVRGLDLVSKEVAFIGFFVKGSPQGPCWMSKEGQGWLYGTLDRKGSFSGGDISYIYPDKCTCLRGRFENGVMIQAYPAQALEANMTSDGILELKMEITSTDVYYSYSPSIKGKITCDWLLQDAYEQRNVECLRSTVPGGGDGLFAKRFLPKGLLFSYYNGYVIQSHESYKAVSTDYLIYIDWFRTDTSAYVDVPETCTNIKVYTASLGHKANHSFLPNAEYSPVDHPRFGRIPGLRTLRDIHEGEEIFCHYKYDMSLADEWYQQQWSQFSLD